MLLLLLSFQFSLCIVYSMKFYCVKMFLVLSIVDYYCQVDLLNTITYLVFHYCLVLSIQYSVDNCTLYLSF